MLPVSEQLLFGANMLARKLLGKKRVAPYMPDFKLAFDHVCIHTGAGWWGRERVGQRYASSGRAGGVVWRLTAPASTQVGAGGAASGWARGMQWL